MASGFKQSNLSPRDARGLMMGQQARNRKEPDMIHGSHIGNQVFEALCNAVENGYDHEYDRPAKDYVLEIHDWSGINCFNHEDPEHVAEGVEAVETWRDRHPASENSD